MLRGLTPTRLVLLGSALLVSAGLLVVAAGSDRTHITEEFLQSANP